MASGNTLLTLHPREAYPENSGNPCGGEFGLIGVGLARGVGFNKATNAGAIWVFRLPATAALATGATFSLLLADDTNNPGAGLVGKFGVNVALLGSNKPVDLASLGTEATATVTMPATSGQTTILSIPIVVANMASVVAGSWVIVRVRRLGADAADTHTGRIVLLGVDMRDT